MKTYRIQMENAEYKWKIMQLQIENYEIQMEKIKYCNV
jgi:hypothetical protein